MFCISAWTAHDHAGGVVAFESTHRTKAGLESSVGEALHPSVDRDVVDLVPTLTEQLGTTGAGEEQRGLIGARSPPGNGGFAGWSPDGTAVVCSSTRNGPRQLFDVSSALSVRSHKLRTGTTDTEPDWQAI